MLNEIENIPERKTNDINNQLYFSMFQFYPIIDVVFIVNNRILISKKNLEIYHTFSYANTTPLINTLFIVTSIYPWTLLYP